MPGYLVEVYLSPSSGERAPLGRDEVSRAADEITRQGLAIQLTQLILVPEDEICFYLFDATSEQAVRLAAARAGLTFSRLAPAVSTRTVGNRPLGATSSVPSEEL